MKRGFWIVWTVLTWTTLTAGLKAQEVGYGDAYLGPASVGSSEPLFRYDEQERWKHGYLKDMPYYEGFHSFRPYNYHHVFSQSQTAAGWGMSPVMPYSQQFWHRYEGMTDLSHGQHTPVAPYESPTHDWDHYPKPLRQGTWMAPLPMDSSRPLQIPPSVPGISEFGMNSAILPAQVTDSATQVETAPVLYVPPRD